MNEVYRSIIDNALTIARAHQNRTTHFIHFHPSKLVPKGSVIPFYENLIFVLLLFKTKNREAIQEGKTLLEKLLSYQSSEGNFPTYLHEYPDCHSRSFAFKLLPPLFWLAKESSHVLGTDLKEGVEKALDALFSYAWEIFHSRDFGYLETLRVAAAAVGMGKHQEEAERLLLGLCKEGIHDSWLSCYGMGEILLSLQMAYVSIKNSPWNLFWEHLSCSWSESLEVYRGPSIQEEREGAGAALTLYDQYVHYFSGTAMNRQDSFCALYGALIAPSEETLSKGEGKTFSSWELWETGGVLASRALTQTFSEKTPKTFRSLEYLWKGKKGNVHSLALEGGCYESLKTSREGECVVVEISLPLIDPSEKRPSYGEVQLYCSRGDNQRVLVEGIAATTFSLEDRLMVEGLQQFRSSFALIEGKGEFLGHVHFANRPSQRLEEEAYDWVIALRTIRQKTPCKLRLTIEHLRCL